MTELEKRFCRWALCFIRESYCWHEEFREVDQLDERLANILVDAGMLEESKGTPIANEFADINAEHPHSSFIVYKFTPAAIKLIDGIDDDDDQKD